MAVLAGAPPFDIRERTFAFACAIVTFCRQFAKRGWIEHYIARQLLRSGTSVGANREEAKSPSSRRDFASKTSIALREARESTFWLRLAQFSQLGEHASDIPGLLRESGELTAILTTMVKKARRAP